MTSSTINKVINLCAIGALTAGGAKVPHTFRPWEVQSIDSIDLRDSCLGSVRYQVRGGQIRRVLPRANDKINGEWATDKGRYSPLDGVATQEVRSPRVSINKDSSKIWETIKLSTAFEEIRKIKPSSIRVIYGGTTDCESIEEISKWCSITGSSLETIAPISPKDNPLNVLDITQSEESFVPSSDKRDNGLLIGCDPRIQSPLLNVQLRERYLEGTEFYNIGGSLDLTYPVQHVGFGFKSLDRLATQSQAWSFVLVGSDIYRRNDASNILAKVAKVAGDTKTRICTTRANETYIRTHSNTKPLNLNASYDLQIIVNTTASEVDAAGLCIKDILSKGKTNIVVTSKGADWRKDVKLILPVLNGLETQSTYISRIAGTRQSEKVISRNDSVLSIGDLFKIRPQTKVVSSAKDVNNTSSSISETPFLVSIVDYHLEGHAFAETSATRARCSTVFTNNRTNFN